MTENYNLEVETEDIHLPNIYVDVQAKIDKIITGGIGSYEYWGYKGYDREEVEYYVDEITYNESEYTPEENEKIKEYISEHFNRIEKDIIHRLCEI